MPVDRCREVRSWWSAWRDDAAPADPASQAHLAGCPACTAWTASADGLLRQARLRPVGSPDITSAALGAFAATSAATRRRAAPSGQQVAARTLLVGAGILGVVATVAALVDGPSTGPLGTHLSQDLAGLKIALSLGFLAAGLRPERFATGLLPVALASAVALLLPGAVDRTVVTGQTLVELTHLPVHLGLAGLLLWFDPGARAVTARRRKS